MPQKQRRVKNKNNKNNGRAKFLDPAYAASSKLVSGVSPKHDSVYTRTLRNVYSVTSSVAGEINSYANDDATQATDWSSFASLFDSYKVVELTYEWFPAATFTTGVLYIPGFLIFDADTNSGIATPSIDKLLQYENCLRRDISKPFSV
jgi:hypothetical protein